MPPMERLDYDKCKWCAGAGSFAYPRKNKKWWQSRLVTKMCTHCEYTPTRFPILRKHDGPFGDYTNSKG